MSNVNNTSSTSTNSVLQDLMKTSSTKKGATDEMSDRFLTMLVTQMQNQDPLNPMDNAQVTTQLSQINMVKGIDTLNTTLDKLLGAYSDALSMQSSALIGKNVLSAGDSLVLGSSGALGGVKLDSAADKVTVTIKDAKGVTVATEELGAQDAGVVDFVWDGKDGNGNASPTGSYTFSVAASNSGSKVKATALELGTVSALVKGSNGFQLEIPGSGLVDFSAVEQIY